MFSSPQWKLSIKRSLLNDVLKRFSVQNYKIIMRVILKCGALFYYPTLVDTV